MILNYHAGWLRVVKLVDGEYKFVNSLIHFSSVTSETTPQTRMMAFIGNILNLPNGGVHKTPWCSVVKESDSLFVFNTHKITSFEKPEIEKSYTFAIEDIHKLLEKLAKLMAGESS